MFGLPFRMEPLSNFHLVRAGFLEQSRQIRSDDRRRPKLGAFLADDRANIAAEINFPLAFPGPLTSRGFAGAEAGAFCASRSSGPEKSTWRGLERLQVRRPEILTLSMAFPNPRVRKSGFTPTF